MYASSCEITVVIALLGACIGSTATAQSLATGAMIGTVTNPSKKAPHMPGINTTGQDFSVDHRRFRWPDVDGIALL
jgi:hypothetical protein